MKMPLLAPRKLYFRQAFLLTLLTMNSGSVDAQNSAIKIGATLALSGKLAPIGVAQQQGLELAIEDVNQNGGINGRRLELIIEDNIGEQKVALNGVTKLLNFDSVDILFSSFSHITQTIEDRVSRAKKIMIYAASLGDIAKNNPLFFRDWGDAESQGAALADAVAAAGHKNVAIDADCVATAMQTTEYIGAAGPLKFDKFGRSNRPNLLIQIKNGVWTSAG